MTGSTSEIPATPSRQRIPATPSRRRFAVVVAATAALVGGLSALVFLVRAGGDPTDAATWPITWELRSSDNGTLFQFWQDVVAGRELDWSFSPQVFVFPELPVSGVAFVLAGGDLYVHYAVVAVIHQVGFFLLLTALARTLWPSAPAPAAVLRGVAGTLPLLLLPLVGTSWVFSFHLASTYYAGMYLALLGAPLLLLVRSMPARIAVAAGLALTLASNPLTLLFAAPGLLAVAVATVLRSGWRALREPAILAGAVAVTALAARFVMTPLQGTGLLTYMDVDVFRRRLNDLWPYWAFQMGDPAARVLLPLGALLAVGSLLAAAAAWVRLAGNRGLEVDRRAFAIVYFGLIPLGGLAATIVAFITHYYYFWPVLVLPFVLAAFAVPARVLPHVAIAGAAALVVVGAVTGGAQNLTQLERYAGYRGAETECLDRSVPGGIGFATFSDARRVALPSATGIRLIPVTADLAPNLWLTNRAYARRETGTFFYLNARGDERALDGETIRARFGAAHRVVTCAEGQSIWVYDEALSVHDG